MKYQCKGRAYGLWRFLVVAPGVGENFWSSEMKPGLLSSTQLGKVVLCSFETIIGIQMDIGSIMIQPVLFMLKWLVSNKGILGSGTQQGQKIL